MKMKGLLTAVLAAALMTASASATLTDLPDSTMDGYHGYSLFNENGVTGRVEYAVYDTTEQILPELDGISGFDNEHYVYAYQVFSSSFDAITSFVVSNFNTDAFAEEDMGTSELLGGNSSNGHDADSLGKYADEAVWFFDSGALIAGQRSYFLLIFSNYAPTSGSYTVNSSGSDPFVPGGEEDNPVPEPMTLVLLGSGALLALRRKA